MSSSNPHIAELSPEAKDVEIISREEAKEAQEEEEKPALSEDDHEEDGFVELPRKEMLLQKLAPNPKLQTTRISNQPADEALEMTTDTERESQPSQLEQRPRGDTPPSAAFSDSDDAYEHEDELHVQGGSRNRKEVDPVEGGGRKLSVKLEDEANVKDLKLAKNIQDTTDNSGSENGEYEDNAQNLGAEGGNTAEDLKELFKYIARYRQQDLDLDTELKPFIPEFIPAVGDIDAFIKIPRPDQKPDNLGLAIVDEPSGKQSDPAVLDLELRALSKSTTVQPQTIRSIDGNSVFVNTKPIEHWIKSIKSLHESKPPPSVQYSKRMPDIEDLMQVWPNDIEEFLKTMTLPSPELDIPLSQYVKILCILLDIPVNGESSTAKKTPSFMIESLHVMFTLYSEFKHSQHFKMVPKLNTPPPPTAIEGLAIMIPNPPETT